MPINIPNFTTTASITGATLVSQADEQLNIFMDDVESYVEGAYSTVANSLVAEVNETLEETQALYDMFDDRYLGSKSSDPLVDNDGNALLQGALYFNSTNNSVKVYTGTAWLALSSIDAYTKTETQTSLPKVGFDTSNVTVPSAGQVAWNQDESTLDLGLNGAVLQIGQEQLIKVRNNTGSTINNGKAVMATGTIGNSGRITIAPANLTQANAKYILGVVTENIAAGADGFCTVFGKVRGIQTNGVNYGETWVDGDVLYVKYSGNGALTKTIPTDTQVKLPVAIVISSHASNGTLFIRVNSIDENHAKAELALKADTTSVNTGLALKVNNSEKGVANGVATLDVNGKVVLTQIPDSVLGQLEYMGTWDFTTIPTATQKGQYWIASVSGNGYIVGDWAVWNGSSFDKVDNTDAVATVAGRTGNVVLTKSDVGLANVDNTADVNKPVSTAQQTAIDTKVAKVTSTDNAIVIFDGPTGNVQNSGVVIDDSNILEVNAVVGAPNFIRFNQLPNEGKKWRVGNTGSSTFSDFGVLNETDNINVLTITPAGNAGLGTTPKNSTHTSLQIKDSIVSVGTTGVDRYSLTNAYYDGSCKRIKSGFKPTRMSEYNGAYEWGIGNDGVADGTVTWTTAMSLDASGVLNVQNLNGTQNFSKRIVIGDSTGAKPSHKNFIEAGSTSWGDNGYMVFGTQNSENMRISTSGNLLVGTTDNGVDKLQVNGSVNTTGIINTFGSIKHFNYQKTSYPGIDFVLDFTLTFDDSFDIEVVRSSSSASHFNKFVFTQMGGVGNYVAVNNQSSCAVSHIDSTTNHNRYTLTIPTSGTFTGFTLFIKFQNTTINAFS